MLLDIIGIQQINIKGNTVLSKVLSGVTQVHNQATQRYQMYYCYSNTQFHRIAFEHIAGITSKPTHHNKNHIFNDGNKHMFVKHLEGR